MNRSMSQAVKQLFTDISPSYDKLNHLLSFNFDQGWRRKAIQMIKRENHEAFQALDLCAGTYDFSLECLKQFPQCEILAADFSFGMLDQGQSKISSFIKKGKIKPVCADGLNLPVADSSIDVIFCGYGVRNFDNTEKGLQEMNRVLKPGGQIIVLEFYKPTAGLQKFFHQTYAQHIIPRLGKIISGHDSAYHYLRDSIQGFLTIPEFNNLLQKTNYKDITFKNFIFSISTAFTAFKKD